MHLSIDSKPEVAGSLASISGCSVARTCGSAGSPKEAAENTGPCLEWKNAFWFSCFLACILPDGRVEHAGKGAGGREGVG